MEICEVEEEHISLVPSFLTVAVAVNGKKNSRSAVKWALERFIPEGRTLFKLLHVRPRITMIPTPMGNSLPISCVREEVAAAYKNEVEWRTSAMLLPYKQMCTQRQVEAEGVIIEADDVAEAISGEIAKLALGKLVLGGSSCNAITRKLRGRGISARISRSVPRFCTVYVISNGKLSSVRAATSEKVEGSPDAKSNASITISVNSSASLTSSTPIGWSDTSSSEEQLYFCSSLPLQRYQALSTLNHAFINKKSDAINHCSNLSHESASSSYSEIHSDFQTENRSWNSDRASTSDTLVDPSLSNSEESVNSENLCVQIDIDFELERLRIELKNVRSMCAMTQNETIDTSHKLNDLSACRMEEERKLKEIHIREEKARMTARQEKEKREAAEKEAEFVLECVEREVLQRKAAEAQATRDAREKRKMEHSLTCLDQQYMKFEWEEIVAATQSFSDSLRIGMGAYGMVYKCNFHHTTAAVKVLHSNESRRTEQFQQELEVLSRIRHPHVLLLIGACPENGCLVYEYMENGSLDDRLLRKNNSPPIPWFDRFRLAWEVASALVFLHNSKPQPIVHRDLKPANILLDHNLVSKIGDVGLSTLLPSPLSSMSTIYKDTAPVGTFCYIDPEYQRTGLVTPKSDLFAFGIVILQLLTAKPPMALAHIVETALQDGRFEDILDREAGKWPIEEAQELASLGLGCAELRRIDRPDLKAEVLPMLERLKKIAENAHDSVPNVQCTPPSHFICPILQDLMVDPYVAADGYTYELRAIETWFSMNDKSPMTNLALPSKTLMPNYTLLSAIKEWKSKNPQ